MWCVVPVTELQLNKQVVTSTSRGNPILQSLLVGGAPLQSRGADWGGRGEKKKGV